MMMLQRRLAWLLASFLILLLPFHPSAPSISSWNKNEKKNERKTTTEPKKKPKRQTQHEKPHIIMIVMDDLGSHDLGMHGSNISTPHCDKLAEEGIYLNNYYVLPTCSPTRAALLSGKYPLHTGVHTVIQPNSTRGLPLGETTIAQMLRDYAGYVTHAVGKWHVGHSMWEQTPTFRGFDSFFGYYLGGQDYWTHRRSLRYDLRHDKKPNCGDGCSKLVNEVGNYSTHVYTREAISRIREHSEREDDAPLFLYLAYQAVHNPNEVPDEYVKPYEGVFSKKRKIYAGMLTAADESIGKVVQALKDFELWDNTLLVFTTDNGGPTEVCAVQGSSNGPLRGGKCTVWEGGTTGDGFLSGPYLNKQHGITTRRRTDGLFHVVDWLPTLAEIAKASTTPNDMDGVSQLGALKGEGAARREIFVGYGYDQKSWYGPAIRKNHWKLIEGSSGGPSAKPAKQKSIEKKSTLQSLAAALVQKPKKGRKKSGANWKRDRQKHIGHRSLGDRFRFANNNRHGNINDDIHDEEEEVGAAEAQQQYLLFDLEHDKEENHNVAAEYPEVVQELKMQLEWYKEQLVPEAKEREDCPYEPSTSEEFGATWLPWCSAARQLVVYE